ncbi:MAG: hypothetical protein ACRD17_14690, partial [Terriglobales bacterium]
ALVRATRTLLNGQWFWQGVIVHPPEAAGKLDPQASATLLVQAAEYQLCAAGVRGAAQITLFFDL